MKSSFTSLYQTVALSASGFPGEKVLGRECMCSPPTTDSSELLTPLSSGANSVED